MVRDEVLHRAEQVKAKTSAFWISRVNRAAAEHFREERMAHFPRRIRIPEHTAKVILLW